MGYKKIQDTKGKKKKKKKKKRKKKKERKKETGVGEQPCRMSVRGLSSICSFQRFEYGSYERHEKMQGQLCGAEERKGKEGFTC